jgi:CRP/FNR family transcriptional regulator, anaerobic regulatory protein
MAEGRDLGIPTAIGTRRRLPRPQLGEKLFPSDPTTTLELIMLSAFASEHRVPGREAWFVQRCAVTASAPAALPELLRAMGTGADPVDGTAAPELAVPVWRVRTGAVLLHEGALPEAVHVVRSGSFKCLKTSEDGYEQVLAFVGPGEVLGFEALSRGRHTSSVVALEDSTVFALPLRELDHWRQHAPALDHAMQFALSRQLARAGETAEMMAAVAAETRLARFLVWMSACMAERGQSPRRLFLRMSRRDIASLLGVAHETVSRSFTALADWGYLRVENREVEILDAAALRACTRNTRGLADEGVRAGQGAARPRASPRPTAMAA